MRLSSAVLFVALLFLSATGVQAAGLELSRYRLTATYGLPVPAADEASAVTYNWDNGNLFVLGDEGDALVQLTKTNNNGTVAWVPANSMTLTGFSDTEGITYIGNGKLVITEERLRDAYLLNYTPGGSVDRSTLPVVDLGSTVGNVGIEGISFDRISGKYYLVKEKTGQEVNEAVLDFVAPSATIASLFTPNFGVLDLADIQVLSSVASLQGSAAAQNLLIFSQESSKLLEVTRGGIVVSQFDFSDIASNVEGVTIDPSGTIFIVGENPSLYVLTPVPEPETYAMLLTGLLVLRTVVGRKKNPNASQVPASTYRAR